MVWFPLAIPKHAFIFSSFVATVEEHGGQLCSFVVWLVLLFVGMI
jgi:hypothetical protein